MNQDNTNVLQHSATTSRIECIQFWFRLLDFEINCVNSVIGVRIILKSTLDEIENNCYSLRLICISNRTWCTNEFLIAVLFFKINLENGVLRFCPSMIFKNGYWFKQLKSISLINCIHRMVLQRPYEFPDHLSTLSTWLSGMKGWPLKYHQGRFYYLLTSNAQRLLLKMCIHSVIEPKCPDLKFLKNIAIFKHKFIFAKNEFENIHFMTIDVLWRHKINLNFLNVLKISKRVKGNTNIFVSKRAKASRTKEIAGLEIDVRAATAVAH